MNLSDLIDRFHCASAAGATIDPLLGFGTYLSGHPHPKLDQALLLDYAEDRRQFNGVVNRLSVPDQAAGSVTVAGREIVNDLYVAKVYRDTDRVVRIRIPGFGPLMSTSVIERDWRLLMIALFAVIGRQVVPSLKALAEETVVLEVQWAERLVMGFVRPAFWETLGGLIEWATTDRPVTSGVACHRCELRGKCQAYERLLDLPGEEDVGGMRKADAAQKLLLALMVARASEKAVIERRRTLAKKLASLTTDGHIDVHGLFNISVHTGDLERYPFGPTKALLQRLGLWRDDFGAMALRPFKAAISGFPPEVQQRLAELKIVDTKEPEIKEIVDGVANSIQAPLLRGVRR